MVRAWRASIELWMHAGGWESTREAFEWHEAKLSASLASRVLSQLPKWSVHTNGNQTCATWHLFKTILDGNKLS